MSSTSWRAKKKSASLNTMFFLPHNLCCLCRKGGNPISSCQSVKPVTVKWKKTERRQKSANISVLPGPHSYSSFLPVISISPTVIVSPHSWAFSHSEFQFTREGTEMSKAKKENSLACGCVACEVFIVHSSETSVKRCLCFTQHLSKNKEWKA